MPLTVHKKPFVVLLYSMWKWPHYNVHTFFQKSNYVKTLKLHLGWIRFHRSSLFRDYWGYLSWAFLFLEYSMNKWNRIWSFAHCRCKTFNTFATYVTNSENTPANCGKNIPTFIINHLHRNLLKHCSFRFHRRNITSRNNLSKMFVGNHIW